MESPNYCFSKGVKLSILSNTLHFNGKREDILKSISVFEGTIHHSIVEKHDAFCGHKGAYEILIDNLKFFSDHDKSVGLAINMIPYNYNVFYDIVKNAIDSGVSLDHILAQRIIQFGRAEGKNDYELTHKMVNTILEQVDRIEKDFSIQVYFEDPLPACSIDKKYIRFAHPCEWGYTKISLDFEGNISRCGADVFRPIGNIITDDILQLWASEPSLIDFRSKKFLRTECSICNKLDICGGGCPISRHFDEATYGTDYLA